jgi:hypothetical protein
LPRQNPGLMIAIGELNEDRHRRPVCAAPAATHAM